ncbi:hypothetical protein [Haliangium sp.]|uniref:hypothetical protein n=1 Tax=Haliangium sp. TaxID=2663208 RepID=UPI003D0D2681
MRAAVLPAFVATLALAGAAGACGGRQIPTHDGYRNNDVKGWESPTSVEFDEDFEGEADGELSYPKRRRARWLAVDLPQAGELDVRLAYSPVALQDEPELDDEDDPFDVAFEVYDERQRMLLRADNTEDDAGERTKKRTLYELNKGRYLIHVYLQRRLDEVDFTVRLQFRPGAVTSSSGFPKAVAFVPELPAIPEVDDAPPPRARCRGRRCRRPPRRTGRPPRRPPSESPPEQDAVVAVPENGLRARVIGIRATGEGTRITINRGSAHGVAKGWSGQVVNAKGKAIADGRFTVVSVKAQESYATVRATPDAVTAAARVVLKP